MKCNYCKGKNCSSRKRIEYITDSKKVEIIETLYYDFNEVLSEVLSLSDRIRPQFTAKLIDLVSETYYYMDMLHENHDEDWPVERTMLVDTRKVLDALSKLLVFIDMLFKIKELGKKENLELYNRLVLLSNNIKTFKFKYLQVFCVKKARFSQDVDID